jgi:hypothetical protein
MGLDMYLYRKTYVKRWDFQKPQEQFSVSAKRGGEHYPDIDPEKVAYIVEEVGYWRKANQIHNWFVKNVQEGKDECQESYVETDQLKALLDACERVLDNHKLADELLPTTGGFFFGSTDYDEWYYNDLRNTVNILKPILVRENERGEYYYHASW